MRRSGTGHVSDIPARHDAPVSCPGCLRVPGGFAVRRGKHVSTRKLFIVAAAVSGVVLAAGCSSSSSGGSSGGGTASSTNASTATSAAAFGGMNGLVAACKKEGTLNVITLPANWANYGTIMKDFTAKYGIKINDANPDGSSQDEINAMQQLKGQSRAPDVLDMGTSFAAFDQTSGPVSTAASLLALFVTWLFLLLIVTVGSRR